MHRHTVGAMRQGGVAGLRARQELHSYILCKRVMIALLPHVLAYGMWEAGQR